MTTRKAVDFTLECHGSIWLVQPMNEAAREHLLGHVSEETQWFGYALVVEWRYIVDLAQRLEDEGFNVK